MKPGEFLYLSRQDIEALAIPLSSIIENLEHMFREKGEGRVEMPPKPGIHTRPNAFTHAMPAYIPFLGASGVKWVSGYPENQKKGLPYVSGLLILNDPDTGIPIAVMDCTWITAMRTGGTTVIAGKHLARKDSHRVGIIACGVQGWSNLEALSGLYQLQQAKAYDIVPEISERFAKEMQERTGVDVVSVATAREAVQDMDIVVTSGPILRDPVPAIEPGWLARGAFACPLDFDSYWQGNALRAADKLATDDISQMRYYRQEGYFRETPEPYADLGEIVAGKKSGRESDDERIICMNLGLALDDMATAILIYSEAIEQGVGKALPL